MSDSEHQSVQGRFGPPPVVAWSVTAMRWPDGSWSVTTNTRREGERFERAWCDSDLSTGDLVEGVVTEAYRLLR